MEWYWDLIAMIVSLLDLAGVGFWLYWFVKPYVNREIAPKAAGITYTVVMVFLYFVPWEMTGMFAYGVGILAAFAVLYAADREKLRQKLFLCMILYLLDWIAHGITAQCRSILFQTVLSTSYMIVNPVKQLWAYIGVEIFCVALRFLLMAGQIWFLNKIYVRKNEDMEGRELALLLITPLLVLAGYRTFAFMANTYEADLGRYIWDANPQFSWIKVCYQMISYPAIATELAFYQSIRESRRKEKEAAVLEGQLADMKKHIAQVEGLYREIRGLKHDMANHVMTLEQLFLQDQRQETAAYLKSLREQLGAMWEGIRTGHPVTDVVVTEKCRIAKEQGVAFFCEFYYPENTRVNAFDVSILLNNALDNAIEAARGCKEPFVRIRSWRRKNVYMLEVCNPFSQELVQDRDTGLLKSARVGEEHGFGLANMRKIAQRYMGDLEIRQEKNMFRLTVMLMVE